MENYLLGEVVSIAGNTVQIRAYQEIEESGLRLGEMGSFIRINAGNEIIYGMVTEAHSLSISKNVSVIDDNEYLKKFGKQSITSALVGEIESGKLTRGVSHYPIVGDLCFAATKSDLDLIYSIDDEDAICVGKISGTQYDACLNLDKLVSRHSAILGTTGSGKSNAVGVLLTELSSHDFPNARVVVVDPHGEYDDVLGDACDVYKIRSNKDQNELCVPYWALSFDDLIDILGGPLSGPNREYLRDKITEAKIQSAFVNGLDMPTELISADTPIPYSIKKLWFELEDFERQTFYKRANPLTKTELIKIGDIEKLIPNEYKPASAGGGAPFLNNQAKGILNFLENMKLKMKDSTYAFMFDPIGYTPDEKGLCEHTLSELIMSWLGSMSSVSIFDLSEVPSEIMVAVSGTILRTIYDALYWGQNLMIGGKQRPVLMVLEEAHIYLKNGEETVAARTIQKIAKEGRKYGVGLCLVSQRPSELDETVLSQCGTIVSLRMNNSKDKGRISGSIQDELQVLTDMLPNLKIGEAIISGEGIKLPSRVRFNKLSNAPKGSNPNANIQWRKVNRGTIDDYEMLVAIYGEINP